MLRTNQGRDPPLSDLLEFVDQEYTLGNDPLFSRDALNEMTIQQLKNRKESTGKSKPVKTFTSQMNKCPACERNYDLDRCKEFTDKSIRDKYI